MPPPPKKKKNGNIVGIQGVTIAYDRAEGLWKGLPKLLCITSMDGIEHVSVVKHSSFGKKMSDFFDQ